MQQRVPLVSTYDHRYREFLGRLYEARARSGLTQTVVARILGRPQSYVSRCESGERRVDAVELAEFAAVYGVDIRWLLSATGKEHEQA